MNSRLGKAKFHYFKVLLDSRVISSIVLFKHTEKLQNKQTTLVNCKTQEGEFQIKH